jgi:aerobic carbon-monoxide dehydrogenase medium subunit
MLDPEHLIDLKRVGELGGIAREGEHVRIGALATHREVEHSPLVRDALPALAELERHVANVRVRAAGTLAGNLAFGEPHADPPALLAALGATVELAGPDGSRELGIEDFLLGAFETALGDDELITAIRVPVPGPGVRAAYRKFQVLERPAVGVAVAARVHDGAFAGAPAVVVGAVDEELVRVQADALDGAAIDSRDARAAVIAAASEAVDPVDDLSGSAEYKRHLTGVLVDRALAALASEGATT